METFIWLVGTGSGNLLVAMLACFLLGRFSNTYNVRALSWAGVIIALLFNAGYVLLKMNDAFGM